MSAVADKLREARALIERGWTQGEFAVDEHGAEVTSPAQVPTCYCALGAISEATVGFCDPDNDEYVGDFSRFDSAAKVLAQSLGVRFSHEIAMWQDAEGRTQAEVLAAFDKAIELAEQSL